MSYNRKNYLLKVSEIQAIVMEHTKRGITQEWVYRTIIFPTYRISRGTFYNYLGCNAKAELKKMNIDPTDIM